MWLFSLWSFRLPAPFCFHGLFRRNRCRDPGIVKIRVVIPPSVVILFCDIASFELSGLLLPCAKTLLKIDGSGTAFKDVSTETDQAVGVQNADQFPIFQGKQCVHQSIHAVDIRNGNGFKRHIQRFCQLRCQIGFRRPVLGLILRQTYIGGIGRTRWVINAVLPSASP